MPYTQELETKGRYHHQYMPDVLSFELGALSDAEQATLKGMATIFASPASRATCKSSRGTTRPATSPSPTPRGVGVGVVY